MDRVLVTGGSGYLAAFCIAQLLERDVAVNTTISSMAREDEVRAGLALLSNRADEVTFCQADLTSDDGWVEAVSGCQGVLHVASPFHAPTTSGDEFTGPARDGALRVIKAGLAAGAERIVLTSSIAAASPEEIPTDRLLDESDWTDPQSTRITGYYRSKTIAEQAAWALVRERGQEKVLSTVCPGGILGPTFGKDYSFSLQLLVRMLKGDMPGLPKMGFNIVDVRDTADLHLRALFDPAAAGERFIASAGFRWFREVADTLKRELGPDAARVPTREVPSTIVRLMSLFDREVRSITPDLGRKKAHTSAKAERVLGWAPRTPEDSILDCARSLIAEGVVEKAAA
jgi:nucleoside-diphosphate-sugar epimerase